jgi:hypothetical protein
MSFYVYDLSKAKTFFPLYVNKKLTIYFFIWHPELTFLENLAANFFIPITELPK